MAILSKKLTEIKTDINLELQPDQTNLELSYDEDLDQFLKSLGFKNIIQKVIEATHKFSGSAGAVAPQNQLLEKVVLSDLNQAMEIVSSNETLYLMINWNQETKHPMRVAFKTQTGEFAHAINLDESSAKSLMGAIFQVQVKRTVFTNDIKTILTYLLSVNLRNNCFIYELEQLHFLVEPDASHQLKRLLARYSQHYSEEDLTSDDISRFGTVIFSLQEAITEIYEKVKMEKLVDIYELIDYPLFEVLAQMEFYGVNVDCQYLQNLERNFSAQLLQVETKIEEISGQKINLKSPKQVGVFLFDFLKLPVIKKTKTGNSTDHEVLEELASRNLSPVPELLINYREIEKLLSTYIKALPELISHRTGKLHTTFSQSTAATGRLASSNPNLQNIPTRTESGRMIRKAFFATANTTMLAADYSQVELRLLAHFSEDPTMLKAFRDNLDIHRQTAAEVLGIPLDQVTKDQRSMAKAVNFGLMYGQSSFGLASTLRISRGEAKDYITRYFTRFNRVKAYLDSLKEFAEIHGHSKTLHGRKRFLPDINSSNRTIKSQAERIAVNSPIQGTAADIIKLAMIRIAKILNEKQYKTKMILQVHDELIFECPLNEIGEIRILVKQVMENVVDLKVPLTVEVGEGQNWYDLK